MRRPVSSEELKDLSVLYLRTEGVPDWFGEGVAWAATRPIYSNVRLLDPLPGRRGGSSGDSRHA